MHGLQEIIIINRKQHEQIKAVSIKWKQQSAQRTIAKLAAIRSGKTK